MLQATPTVLGVLWGMGITAFVLPQYASDGMLALEAACLRGTFAAINRCVCLRVYVGGRWGVQGAVELGAGPPSAMREASLPTHLSASAACPPSVRAACMSR